MKRFWRSLVGLVIIVSTIGIALPAQAQTVQHNIEEFLEVQAVPLGWCDPVKLTCINVDYAGKNAGELLNTSFSGKVTERPLPEGGSEVQVILHTKNANT